MTVEKLECYLQTLCTDSNAEKILILDVKVLNEPKICDLYWYTKPVWPSWPFAAVQQCTQLQTLPRMHDVDVWP